MRAFFRKRLYLLAIPILALMAATGYLYHNRQPNELAEKLDTPPWNEIRNDTLRESIQTSYLSATSGFVSTDALSQLGRLYHANGYLSQARQAYEILDDRGETTSKERYRLAHILSTYGMQDQAISLYRRVIAQSPDYNPARIQLGNALLKSRKASEAEAAFREAIENDSRSAHALLGLARLRIERAEWEDARKILEAATRISNYQIGADLLATVYEALGQTDQANRLRGDRDFGAYRDLPDPWIEEILGDCYDTFRLATAAGMASFRSDFDKAKELIGRAIELAPPGSYVALPDGRNLPVGRRNRFRLGTLPKERSAQAGLLRRLALHVSNPQGRRQYRRSQSHSGRWIPRLPGLSRPIAGNGGTHAASRAHRPRHRIHSRGNRTTASRSATLLDPR